MKRKAKSILLSCFLVLYLLFMAYFLLAFYYREGFSLNTWINGVYCTGKTVEEVNAELLSKIEAPIVIITDKNGESYSIDMADAGYQADFTQPLNRYMEEQNPMLWVDNIMFHKDYEMVPDMTYDEEMLRMAFDELDFVKDEQLKSNKFALEYNREVGFYLTDGLTDRIDIDKVYEALKETIDAGEYSLNLTEIVCYYDIPLTRQQEETRKLAEKLEKFQNCNIVYDMGDQMLELDAVTMSDFVKSENGVIVLDEDDNPVLDEKAITKFIASLAEEYDTYGKETEFLSTRGDLVTVQRDTYGTEIDQEAEVSFLMEQLLKEESHNDSLQYHVPSYKQEAFVRGKNDIGQTYIEIDMTEQKMYYYEDGELMLETEVVTGNTGRRWGTPEGVNYVYSKQTNRVLCGEGYATPVKYWMPVNGNIGIHDASWRDEFGGTIYQKNGSHGCINTPEEKMTELYEMVEIGTPVVMFY